MHVNFMTLERLDERTLERWRDLACSAVEPNPFLEPELAVPAARHLDSGTAFLLVVGEGDRWDACLAVARRRWRGLSVPVVASWKHPYCFLGTPLVRSDRVEQAVAALVGRGLPRLRTGLFALDRFGADGQVAGTLDALFASRRNSLDVYAGHDRAALRRRPGPDYLDDMRPHHRRELGRLRRRLEGETGSVRVVDSAGDPAAVERFLRLEGKGWKGRTGTAFASSSRHAAFLFEVCRNFAGAGRLELLEMTAGGTTVAMKCNLLAGDAVFCFKIAFDEEWARFSPGVLLEVENVERFHAGEATWMDSCADPDNAMINRLWPDRRRISTLLVPCGGAFGQSSRLGARVILAARRRKGRANAEASGNRPDRLLERLRT